MTKQSEFGRKSSIRLGVVEVNDVGMVGAQQILISNLTCRKVKRSVWISLGKCSPFFRSSVRAGENVYIFYLEHNISKYTNKGVN